jgi:hypothetical protein
MTDDPNRQTDVPPKDIPTPIGKPIAAPPPPVLPPEPEPGRLEPKLPCKDEWIAPGGLSRRLGVS